MKRLKLQIPEKSQLKYIHMQRKATNSPIPQKEYYNMNFARPAKPIVLYCYYILWKIWTLISCPFHACFFGVNGAAAFAALLYSF